MYSRVEAVFADTLRRTRGYSRESNKYRGLLNEYDVPHNHNTVFEIKNINCVEACLELKKLLPDKKLSLLNCASDICPGGGVKKGSLSWEEDVCRTTTLYNSIACQQYPIMPDEIIYSSDVYIIKNSIYQLLPDPVFLGGVLTIPAVRLPNVTANGTYVHQYDRDTMQNKVRLLLQTASYHNIEVLVLGAFGNGAFRNPPEEVAKIFKDALDGEFKNTFHTVYFAILENNPSEPLNAIYKRVILP